MTRNVTSLLFCLILSPAFAEAQESRSLPKSGELSVEKTTPPASPVESPVSPVPPAQEPTPPKTSPVDEVRSEVMTQVNEIERASHRERREHDASVTLHLAPFDLILPMKYGASVGLYGQSGEVITELEYLRASMAPPGFLKDIGEMTDQRLSLHRRSFGTRESFNWFWGVDYHSFDVHLGNDYLQAVAPQAGVDLLKIETLGLNIGIGNRWSFGGRWILSLDWFTWSQPLVILNRHDSYLTAAANSSQRDDVDSALKAIAYFPRFSLLNIGIGASF